MNYGFSSIKSGLPHGRMQKRHKEWDSIPTQAIIKHIFQYFIILELTHPIPSSKNRLEIPLQYQATLALQKCAVENLLLSKNPPISQSAIVNFYHSFKLSFNNIMLTLLIKRLHSITTNKTCATCDYNHNSLTHW